MRKFKLKANAEFEAKDIDHALKLLSEHFDDVLDNIPNKLITSGKIEIECLTE